MRLASEMTWYLSKNMLIYSTGIIVLCPFVRASVKYKKYRNCTKFTSSSFFVGRILFLFSPKVTALDLWNSLLQQLARPAWSHVKGNENNCVFLTFFPPPREFPSPPSGRRERLRPNIWVFPLKIEVHGIKGRRSGTGKMRKEHKQRWVELSLFDGSRSL